MNDDDVLTEKEIQKLLELLRSVILFGHGEISIRVVKGSAKYISARYEHPLFEKGVEKNKEQE